MRKDPPPNNASGLSLEDEEKKRSDFAEPSADYFAQGPERSTALSSDRTEGLQTRATHVSQSQQRSQLLLEQQVLARRRAESWDDLIQVIRGPLLKFSPVILIILYLFGAGWLRSIGVLPRAKMPSVLMSAVGGSSYIDSCDGKSKCLVIFMAPWCPACHGSLGFMQTARRILQSRSDRGFKIIVGSSEVGELEEFAAKIGGHVYLDGENKFWSKVDRGGVPRWWIVNQQKEIVKSGSGLWGNSDQKTVEYLLKTEWELL